MEAILRPRTGQIFKNKKNGKWVARVSYKNTNGKRTSIQRQAKNKTHARKILKQLLDTLEKRGRSEFDNQKLTINDLCDYYQKHYAKPAQIVNGKKVSGLRSYVAVRGYIKLFRQYLGAIKLSKLTYEDLSNFRDILLNRSTHQSEKMSVGTVNRYLAYLRRILIIAERNRWIERNPFKCGDPLIRTSDEVKRTRVLTIEESQRLINACHSTRSHIRPIVIAALDTGCRFNELTSLKFQQIDFEEETITILSENTKTFNERQVGITNRLKSELLRLWEKSDKNLDSNVFGVRDIRCAFKSACKEANLENLRFHDLRRCHATRLNELGFSIASIGKQLGHSGDYKVTLRYISRDKQNIQKVVDALDKFHSNI